MCVYVHSNPVYVVTSETAISKEVTSKTAQFVLAPFSTPSIQLGIAACELISEMHVTDADTDEKVDHEQKLRVVVSW